MNIIVSTLNSQYIHSSLAPWCLVSGIEKYCTQNMNTCVVEGTVNEPPQNVISRITSKSPDVIGFACYIWNITQTLSLVERLKELIPNLIVVLGGPEVSYRAEDILINNKNVDFVCSGEGELPFALLVDAVCNNEKDIDIPGICYIKNGEAVIKEPYISNCDPPSPYSDKYISAANGRIAYIETSRGCPFSCAFCLSGRCGMARSFNIEEAKKNIIKLACANTKTIKFVDRTFNADIPRALEIVSFIIENYGNSIPTDVCFHFEIAGDILNDRLIELFSSAPKGLIQLEIGLQSFNKKTLEAVHRKTDIEKLKSNIEKLLINRNMHIHIDLIAGLPYEGLESFKSSFNKAFMLYADMLQLGFLKLIYGSQMRENENEFPCEYSKDPPYEVISTEWISSAELFRLHKTENALNILYNSGRFRKTIEYMLETLNILPYDFFEETGILFETIPKSERTLDSYTNSFYDYYKTKCDGAKLRDIMIIDRLSTNSSGIIPSALRIYDSELKYIKIKLDSNPETRQNIGVKRSIAILYSLKKEIYVDYVNPDKILGKYEVHII